MQRYNVSPVREARLDPGPRWRLVYVLEYFALYVAEFEAEVHGDGGSLSLTRTCISPSPDAHVVWHLLYVSCIRRAPPLNDTFTKHFHKLGLRALLFFNLYER